MNVTPPEGVTEYSTGSGGSKPVLRGRLQGDRGRRGRPVEQVPGSLRAAILAGSLLGALLLVVAEFTTLFTVHVETSKAPIKTVATGPHHSYALLLIAIVVAVLAVAVWRDCSRPALLAIGLLGVVALLIALLGDLPDAHAAGLAGTSTTRYVDASSTPSAGLYLETLGAVVLVITCGVGFIALGSPRRRAEP
jgi:uncharacterized membrane protein